MVDVLNCDVLVLQEVMMVTNISDLLHLFGGIGYKYYAYETNGSLIADSVEGEDGRENDGRAGEVTGASGETGVDSVTGACGEIIMDTVTSARGEIMTPVSGTNVMLDDGKMDDLESYIGTSTSPHGHTTLEASFKSSMSYIFIFSKYDMKDCKSIDITCYQSVRNVINVVVKNISITAVHLEIGQRFHHLEAGRERYEIVRRNSNDRLYQLDQIIHTFNPDVIVGDFNFTINDREYTTLLNRKYYVYPDFVDTNPFNRCDWLYGKVGTIDIIKGWTIKCNYSDHLPIVTYIKTMVKR
jgi:endonuclease/exonuclease/phosphatase family metal-dependent hydrolase